MSLPFVWEIKHIGVISHIIGTHHYIPNTYRKEDCSQYLDGKKAALFEGPTDILENAKNIIELSKIFPEMQAEFKHSVDFLFYQEALEKKVNIINLENRIYIDAISSIHVNFNKEEFKKNLQREDRIRERLQEIYKKGDEKTLKRLLSAQRKLFEKYLTPEQLYLFEDKRNEIMANALLKRIQMPCALICGAGHMYEKKSIIRILKENGIKAQRI